MPINEVADRLGERYERESLSTDGSETVVAGQSGESPLLVSRSTDETRLPVLFHELSELREAVTERDAQFGALFAPGVEYVFQTESSDSVDFERTVPALPDADGTVETGARPFESATELCFCFHRLYNLELPGESLAAEERKQKFAALIRALGQQTDGDGTAAPESAFEQAIAAVFEAFDLEATGQETLVEFVDYASEIDSIQRYSTRSEIARFLVDLAAVDDGETVLDPAAGVGNIVRAAAEQGADAVGIDLDEEAVSIARFFNDLLDLDVTMETANFLEDEAPIDDPDHIILEPPSTRNPSEDRVGSLVTQEGEHIEETIFRQAAEQLPAGSTLTALVPFGMLVRPDEHAREFREYLRENYRIETLVEVINPAYYPYPGVRTGVIQLTPDEEPGEYDVQVDRFVAGSESGRFEAAEGKSIETLLEETLEKVRAGTIETIPISAFGTVLDPSDALRRRELVSTLSEAYPSTGRLEDVATEIRRGAPLQRHELDDSGVPHLRVATITGHEDEMKYVADPDDDIVATASDLLVSVKGTVGMIRVPDEPVVPGPEWAIVRFDSEAAAATYQAFFETTVGEEVQEALEASAVVPYPRYTPILTVRRLRKFVVPRFEPDEIERIATAIRDLGEDPTREELDSVFGV